jgi:hypothetical protein
MRNFHFPGINSVYLFVKLWTVVVTKIHLEQPAVTTTSHINVTFAEQPR